MDSISVVGGVPLTGSVVVQGAKNSVLKLMAACLLAEGRHVLDNVPAISDVATMTEILRRLGAKVWREGSSRLVIDVPSQIGTEIPKELSARMRASVVLLGPLVARMGEARLALPGGDDFGQRPIDFHVKGLSAMGAEVWIEGDYVIARAPQGLHGALITLEFASHTTTDNLLMASVLARGETVIDNAAREPEVADLARFLRSMGARVVGAGTSRIEVRGVDQLGPARHIAIGDRVEAATFLAAVGCAKGEIIVEGIQPGYMRMLLEKLSEMGLEIDTFDGGMRAACSARLRATDIATLPYPGVATDYKPLVVAMLASADGASIVTENLFFGGRFRYVEELCRMGADVRVEDHHAIIRGTERLRGARVSASDIRAGAALVVAALGAEGETVISGAHHIDRGYEDLVGKLARFGAKIVRF
jgi:UDP-N-acetylglucosamine 1-carboxyvinyltransferase